MKKLSLILVGLCIFASCSVKSDTKSGSAGKTCEILTVCSKTQYDAGVRDTIKAFFMRNQLGLNQAEPLFNVANITPELFNNTEMFQRHRNLILVEFDKNKAPSFIIRQDVEAIPQAIFTFIVPNKHAFDSLFAAKRELMLKVFYNNEHKRIIRTFKSTENTDLTIKQKSRFGFWLTFPDAFKVATLDSNFAWIRCEAKDYGQGILVYTFPYTDKNIFNTDIILNIRDKMTQAYVPGPTDGTYMSVERKFMPPFSKEINFNGHYAIETRGLWKLGGGGDFMGGPFINYVFIDEKNSRVVMIDGYLYSPRKPKRDLLMQVESIIYSYTATDSIR